MASRKKTFNIGESALGGIITAEVDNDKVVIQCLDWATKEPVRTAIYSLDKNRGEMEYWLEVDITSFYFTDKIVKWIYNE